MNAKNSALGHENQILAEGEAYCQAQAAASHLLQFTHTLS